MACDPYTKLMCHFNGADAATSSTDSSQSAKSLTFVGNAQLDTAQKVFGLSSLLLDGSGDYVTVADSSDWDFGTGDFTIDGRFRTTVSTQDLRIFEIGASDSDGVQLKYSDGAGKVAARINGTEYAYTKSISTNTWYHFACVRSSGTFYIYIDGVSIGSGTSSQTVTCGTAGVAIGADTDGSLGFNGWIDEFRVSKGIARWTSTFTLPVSEYCITPQFLAFFENYRPVG